MDEEDGRGDDGLLGLLWWEDGISRGGNSLAE